MKHLYRLLIFVGLVLHVYVQCQTICRKDQYTVVKPDGSKSCLNCDTCHPGHGLDPPCGSQIPYPPKIDCVTCPDGTFSDELDSAPCHSCQRCAEHEIVTAPCTNQSDRICNGTCEVGYFYSKKDSTHSCKKCSYCCLDEKDEEIPECANQGLEASKQHCHPRPDKDCNPDSSVISSTTQKTGTDASTNGRSTGVVIGGVFGGMSFIVMVAIALFYVCLLRRKKAVEAADAQQSSKLEEGNGEASSTCTLPYASEGPQLATTSSPVQIVRFKVPSDTNMKPQVILEPEKSAPEEKSGETAAATTAKQHGKKTEKLPDVKMSGKPSLSRQNSRDSQNSGDGETGFRKRSNSAIKLEKLTRKLSERDDSLLKEESAEEIHEEKSGETAAVNTAKQHDEKTQKLPGVKMGGKPSLSRQNSRDSQNSGDGETGFRKRSNSAIRLEKLTRKLSERDDSLLKEESAEEIHEAITIIEKLSSQKKKEGSKVELVFKCKARGNSKLTYRWYKDGTELQGKVDGTLVLKSVSLPDFGWYKCVASFKDSSDNEESSLAELDVVPRDGTMYKCLSDIDLDTRDRIEIHLTQTSSIIAGWRQIASKYGMDQLKIKSLENDQEAGKITLEFLRSVNPDLTVYDFCKTLKDIRRLDIVNALRGHLSVSCSSKVYV